MSTKTENASRFADWLGIAASTACGLHCILIPVLLVTGTVLPASFLTDESFHRALLWLIIPAAFVAFSIGCWRHKDRLVMALGIIGLVGIVSAGLFLHDIVGETGERVVTLISAGILIYAHYRNYKMCRADSCSQ